MHYLTLKSNSIKILFFMLLFSVTLLSGSLLKPQLANALSGADFKPGRIIDDVIFYNNSAMTSAQIQQFLNAKVPTCDTNGTQPYAGTTRAAYGASRGYPAPYTCLKDYSQTIPAVTNGGSDLCKQSITGGTKSAAQIIYDVAQACGINPQVLIVMLQKEQSLITDDWPWTIQYNTAMGYACPDSGPNNSANCNSEYFGFFNQVYNAAKAYRRYEANPNSYNYKANRNNTILWHPNSACGTSNVFIENQATASLYIYTPYRPNQAALNNLYGTGDGCSSYGNRNFWRMFNDWFGTPINDVYLWEVVHNTDNGRLYLVVNNTHHWIPNPSILNAWGLNDETYEDVDTLYINQLNQGPRLESVALDINGTRYLMSQGKKYRLKNDAYVLIWGVAGMNHISAPGLVASAPSGGDAGRFAQLPDTTTYLLNNNTKHLPLNVGSFSHWGITSSQTTPVLASDIAHLSNGPEVDQFINFNGNNTIIDSGLRYDFANSDLSHAWSNQNYVSMSPFARNMLISKNMGSFVQPIGSSKVYFVENGIAHHIPDPSHASIWGVGANNPVRNISSELFDNLTIGLPVGYTVNDSTNTYIVSGKKYPLANSNIVTLYNGASPIPTYSNQSLRALSTGKAITSPLVTFSGQNKVFVVDDGQLRAVANSNTLDAYGKNRNNPLVTLSLSLRNLMSSNTQLGLLVSNNSNTYYLENGYRYLIDPNFVGTWKSSTAQNVSSELLLELTPSGQTLGAAVKHAGKYYLMNNGVLIDVTKSKELYGLSSSSFKNITKRYFPSTNANGIFVQSMTGRKVYVLSYGKTYHISNPQTLSDLGFGVHSGLINLHPNIMNTILIEQIEKASRLVKTPTSGVLFASNRKGYSMPDLSTLREYKGSKDYMIISPEYFNKFTISGTATKLVSGSSSKVYGIENNQKRWITNQNALISKYAGIPILSLPQSTIDGFSTGPNIN